MVDFWLCRIRPGSSILTLEETLQRSDGCKVGSLLDKHQGWNTQKEYTFGKMGACDDTIIINNTSKL
jgi:hypothetical protein